MLSGGRELEMLIVEERALVTDLQDKIIKLLVQKEEAGTRGDAQSAENLQGDIDRLRAECADIRQSAGERVAASRPKR